jgi:hypothetical protein
LADTAEPVVLTVPRGALAISAMRIVAGWVASCNDLALDGLDDINLALETLLMGEPSEGDPFSLTVRAADGEVHLLLGGLLNQCLLANLRAGAGYRFEPTLDWPLDVRLFLTALLDGYGVVECPGAAFGVSMQKRIN